MTEEKCNNCGREITYRHHGKKGSECMAAYAYVVHDYYGCDSGCCGYNAILCDINGNELDRRWEFTHDYNNNQEKFANDLCKSHWPLIKVDFEKCQFDNC